MTVARSVARAVASPVARPVGAGIGGGLTLSQVVADAVGYWPLQDDAVSTLVSDQGTSSNNGTLAGGDNTADLSIAGPNSSFSKAMNFDGVADFVATNAATEDYSFIQNTAVFSIAAWIKSDVPTSRDYFLGNTLAASGEKGFSVGLENSAGIGTKAIRCNVIASGGAVITFRSADNAIPDTAWHHVCIVCNADIADPQIFIDGAASAVTTEAALATVSTGGSTRALTFGKCNFSSALLLWDGAMSGLAIWDRALSAGEVAAIYAG